MKEKEKKLFFYGTIGLVIASVLGYTFSSTKKRRRRRRKPRIFISHSWKYSRDYSRLERILESKNLKFYNHSITEKKADKSLNAQEIEDRIKNQLLYSRCLLVFAGMDTSRYWVKKEIVIARRLRKKIIVVKRYEKLRVPKFLKSNAYAIIPFEKKAIVNSIIRS